MFLRKNDEFRPLESTKDELALLSTLPKGIYSVSKTRQGSITMKEQGKYESAHHIYTTGNFKQVKDLVQSTVSDMMAELMQKLSFENKLSLCLYSSRAGTGKTTTLKSVGNYMLEHGVVLEFSGSNASTSLVKECVQSLRSSGMSDWITLLIDEADEFLWQTTSLKTLLDGSGLLDKVVLVVTTNSSLSSFDSALWRKSRFQTVNFDSIDYLSYFNLISSFYSAAERSVTLDTIVNLTKAFLKESLSLDDCKHRLIAIETASPYLVRQEVSRENSSGNSKVMTSRAVEVTEGYF